MDTRHDSDEDGGGKAIPKKVIKMILAIDSAVPVLINSMDQEMSDGESKFDAQKFVEVFKKYTPHFVQMFSAESSDESDDDEIPLPKKYLPFLTAFAKSVDGFVDAIKKYPRMKEVNFSVFTSHPEEVFKSFEKFAGRLAQSSSTPQQCISNIPRNGENIIASSQGPIDDSLNRMNINYASVDMDQASLLSAQEEELRKTIESDSNTPTPTIEDWQGVEERKLSMERTNDHDKTPTKRETDSMKLIVESRKAVFDAVPLTVPPAGQRMEYGRPFPHPDLLDNGMSSREMSMQSGENRNEDIGRMEQNGSNNSTSSAQPIGMNSVNNSTSYLSSQSSSQQSQSLQPQNGISTVSPSAHSTVSDVKSLSVVNDIVPSLSSPLQSTITTSNISNISSTMKSAQTTGEEEQVGIIMDALKDRMSEVHQDLRYALPPMVERAVRVHLRGKKSLTLKELIGEELADEKLEKFMAKMLSKDQALMQIFAPEFRDKDICVHLRLAGPLLVKDNEGNGIDGVKEEKIEENRVIEKQENDNFPALISPNPSAVKYKSFYPKNEDLPLILEDAGKDVCVEQGHSCIYVSRANVEHLVVAQLHDIRNVNIDHLNLSTANILEKGRPVLLRSDIQSFHRGVIKETWNRDFDRTNDVICFLVDYASDQNIPIESIYAFPDSDAEFPSPAILYSKLDAYPIGATKVSDKLSESEWNEIRNVVEEWKKKKLDVHILRSENYECTIDMRNENGESLTDELVKRRIVKRELMSVVPPLIMSSPPCMSTMSIPTLSSPSLPPPLPLDSDSLMEKDNVDAGILISAQSEIVPSKGADTPTTITTSSCPNPSISIIDSPINNMPAFGTKSGDLPLSSSDDKPRERQNEYEQANEIVVETHPSSFNNKNDCSVGGEDRWISEIKNTDLCPTIPASMNVSNGLVAPPSALMMVKETERRDYLEIPSPGSMIPSLFQIVPQSNQNTSHTVFGLSTGRTERSLVQVVEENE